VDQSCILYEVGGVTEGLEENKRTEIFKSKVFGLSEMYHRCQNSYFYYISQFKDHRAPHEDKILKQTNQKYNHCSNRYYESTVENQTIQN
jgi:hypothetical protein